MADFRKLFYGLATTALIAGFTAPAYAQTQSFVCTTSAGVPPIVRAEGYAELVGDLIIDCTGGTPTTAGQVVPQVNITILLSTTVTSKILAGVFTEALLIVDEPNSPVGAGSVNPSNVRTNRPILNCGNTGAPDINPAVGPGVCSITSNGDPQLTYDGKPNAFMVPGADAETVCGTTVTTGTPPVTSLAPGVLALGAYGCGRPNVFQGRQAIAQPVQNAANSIVFLGVPLDPPGDCNIPNQTRSCHRILRITNVRADATYFAGANLSGFGTSEIRMDVAINGVNSVGLPNPSQRVAYVQRGLIISNSAKRTDFIQCIKQDLPKLAANGNDDGTRRTLITAPVYNPTGMSITFSEGFASSFKVKGWEMIPANSTPPNGPGAFINGRWNYDFITPKVNGNNAPLRQNVPGAVYNTESGFNSPPTGTANWSTPNPNPPQGLGTVQVTGGGVLSSPSTTTNINLAGVATQGTRLALRLTAVPGSIVSTPAAVFLTRQGTTSTNNGGAITGVAVRVSGPSATDGSGGSLPDGTNANNSPATWVAATTSTVFTGLAVYEVLFDDPLSLEDMLVPLGVSYAVDLTNNRPDPTVSGQVAGGFAPFYAGNLGANLPSATLPVPRFVPGSTFVDFYQISKCACNILFPFVASTGVNGFDTAVAIANTSGDPTNSQGAPGFTAQAQSGSLQFWYFNTGSGQAAVASQCPNSTTTGACPGNVLVPAGGSYVYQLSQGNAGATGVSAGLKDSAKSFVGYMIARTDFQYCHAFAYISATGAGPANPGISVGYIGLLMDTSGAILPRTVQTLWDPMGR